MPGEEPIFLNKLGEIPLINDGWSTATGYYSQLKDYNTLMRLALSMAESSVKVAGQISTPVLNHYQLQIENMNEYACKKLDELEEKYPAIKQPTEQWKESCVGQVKPVISQVQGIVNNGKQKIANIKTASTNMVEGAKTRGVGTATHVFNSTFESAPGRFVTRTVDSALDIADGLVDKYLPEEEKDVNSTDEGDSSHDDSDDSENDIEEMKEMDPTPKRVLIHAGSVTEKLRRRMFNRAMKDLTYAKLRASSAVNHMQKTITLIDPTKGYAQQNLHAIKDKADDLWIEITKDYEPSTEERTIFAGSAEDRVIALGRLVMRQVKQNVTAFEKVASEFGQFSRHPISKTKEYKDLMETFISVESVQSFTSQNLARANSSLKFIQSKIQTILNNVKSMDWVSVDIDMEDIPLNESDIGIEQVVCSNNNSEDDDMEVEQNQ